METALDISLQNYGWSWVLRPISAIIGALALLTVVLAATGFIRRRRESTGVMAGEGGGDEQEVGLQKFISLPFSILMLAVSIYVVWEAHGWPREAALLVLAFGYPAIALTAGIIFSDVRSFRFTETGARGASMLMQYGDVLRGSKEPRGVLIMYGWFAGIVLITYVTGQMFALPIYVFVYLKFWCREGWRLTLIYTGCAGLLLWGMFGEIIHVVWQPPLLDFLPQ